MNHSPTILTIAALVAVAELFRRHKPEPQVSCARVDFSGYGGGPVTGREGRPLSARLAERRRA